TLREARHAQECLLAGITTVRDCGGRGLTTLAVRDAIADGLLPGPRVLASGMPITTTFGHLYFCGLEVEGVDNVRVAARKLAKEGVDFLKVMATGGIMTHNANPAIPRYSQAELDAICEEARMLNKRVAAHVGSAEGVRRCVQTGVNTIEHCGWANPDGTSGYDPRVAERMAEEGVFAGATVAGIVRNRLLPESWPNEAERQRGLEETHRGWQRFREMRALRALCPLQRRGSAQHALPRFRPERGMLPDDDGGLGLADHPGGDGERRARPRPRGGDRHGRARQGRGPPRARCGSPRGSGGCAPRGVCVAIRPDRRSGGQAASQRNTTRLKGAACSIWLPSGGISPRWSARSF
ncbi:MAG: amidohydrolase family protein, partial [Chloroflexi bacterium]|nr:amidohydrolase family protein [Chloroflexota bacterium]